MFLSVTFAPSMRRAFSSSPVEVYVLPEYVPSASMVFALVPCVNSPLPPPKPPGLPGAPPFMSGGCCPSGISGGSSPLGFSGGSPSGALPSGFSGGVFVLPAALFGVPAASADVAEHAVHSTSIASASINDSMRFGFMYIILSVIYAHRIPLNA